MDLNSFKTRTRQMDLEIAELKRRVEAAGKDVSNALEAFTSATREMSNETEAPLRIASEISDAALRWATAENSYRAERRALTDAFKVHSVELDQMKEGLMALLEGKIVPVIEQ